MDEKRDNLREQLLAQHEPDSEKSAAYRREVDAMLENNERALRREKWVASSVWVFMVLLTTVFLVLGGMRPDTPPGVWVGLFGVTLLIGAAAELIKYFINRSRVELLKEMKGLELQLLEIKEKLNGRSS